MIDVDWNDNLNARPGRDRYLVRVDNPKPTPDSASHGVGSAIQPELRTVTFTNGLMPGVMQGISRSGCEAEMTKVNPPIAAGAPQPISSALPRVSTLMHIPILAGLRR